MVLDILIEHVHLYFDAVHQCCCCGDSGGGGGVKDSSFKKEQQVKKNMTMSTNRTMKK